MSNEKRDDRLKPESEAGQEGQQGLISRRKLLASVGMASVALAAGAFMNGANGVVRANGNSGMDHVDAGDKGRKPSPPAITPNLKLEKASPLQTAAVNANFDKIDAAFNCPGGAVKVYCTAVGDGVTDDTAAIQAVLSANPGRYIDFGDGYTYLISNTLMLESNCTYFGKSKLIAKAGVGLANSPMMMASGQSRVLVIDLELDGNADNNGMGHGLRFEEGSYNTACRVFVHDAIQCGIQIRAESHSHVYESRVEDCGRLNYAENHGIMVYTTSATRVHDVHIVRTKVFRSYRKGITTYSSNAEIRGVYIRDCDIEDNNLGGVYCASVTPNQYDVHVSGCYTKGNYVNIEFSNVQGFSVKDCISESSQESGILLDAVKDGEISGNTVYNSGTRGINVEVYNAASSNLNIHNNVIVNSNRTNNGYAPGINVTSLTYSDIRHNLVYDEGTPKATFGIYEQSASDYNLIEHNRIGAVLVEKIVRNGANTLLISYDGARIGLGNAPSPQNTLDIAGGLTIRTKNTVLSNGSNHNVSLPVEAGVLYMTGPTASSTITGIAGGHEGRIVKLINFTQHSVTLSFNSGGSSAGNRILIGGSADMQLPAFGTVELTYVAAAPNAWIVTAKS